ncbi:uncharacterized protein N7496_001682 [Penicillium cataractarum]|uniref:Uncharacterized protein n=1 Tax=Penicillium cataractarum TaxID=2100454 RepID=A0A9W9VWV2_9EURO|nr:uncharacterized protein N7496_001682 [Penicillium cataractarum]KAJ5390614.1 hypothetical protein N7496_001682 [Penicillium cataractarum]
MARPSIASITGPTKLPAQRSYARDSNKSSGGKENATRDAGTPENPLPNHPIPSNDAKPTLRDGRSSPIADFEGNLKDDLPEDVKKHNEDVENRYDRPYNHIADWGVWRRLV